MHHLSQQLRRFLTSPLALYACIALSFFLGLGSVPLFDLDEGAFTEATREMLESGIFSATYLDGEPRYDKPIFFYWLQASSVSVFGFNEWAFRLPSALMACLWTFAVFSFVREFVGRTRGLIAALFLVNSLWIALISRAAIADATLNVFLCMAIFDIWRYTKYQKTSLVLRIYLWMALATLTKGPVGVVVPLLTSLIFFITSRVDKKLYLAYLNPLGWLVYIGTVAPWVIAVYMEQGNGFFEGFIVEHNLKRFSATRESHGGTIFYYLLTLPLIVLPYTGLLAGVFKPIKQQLSDPLSRYLLIWFAVFFVIFSLSKTQLPHYILNGCVPLIILFARQKKLFHRRRWSTLFPIAFMALLVVLPQLIAIAAESSRGYDGAALSRHNDIFTVSYTIFAIVAFALMLVASLLPKLLTWQRLVIVGVILNSFTFTVFAKVASNFQQAPIHSAIQFIEQRKQTLGIEETVVAYKMHMPSFSVYRERITPLRAPQNGELAITRVDRVDSLNRHVSNQLENSEAKPIWQMGGLIMFEISSTNAGREGL
ncbi:ArnT family glycosyltransferase [Teredinibacter haidensis]|uniref:ArnT family glycosyltransferase n=1 Tax=Teredinibacter haidensis TaxID=2731755 RepID=UPI000948B999|nr:glycosyltransferase family 39 protein [Teredinibacter haidensis]